MIGVVCGLASEVRTLGRWARDSRIIVGVSGARPERAEEIAMQMVSQDNVRLLVSWGIAGGLRPGFPTGRVIIPEWVALPDGTNLQLAARLLPSHDQVVIVGSDEVVASVEAKRWLTKSYSQVAVDMETHRVAITSRTKKIPCVAIRAISDTVDTALPDLATDALDVHGKPRIWHVIKGLLRQPGQLPALIGAMRDSDAALAALAGTADHVFPALLESPLFSSDL